MKTSAFTFPAGQSERAEPRLLPAPALRAAQNVRFRKDGRAAKKYGNAAIGTSSLTAGTYPSAIAKYGDAALLVQDAVVYAPYGSSGWSSRGKLSRWLPENKAAVARGEGSDYLARSTVAYSNGLLIYAWDDNSSVYFTVHTTDGQPVTYSLIGTGKSPRLVAVGNTVWCYYKNGAALKSVSFDMTAQPPVASAVNAIVNLDSASDQFDAAPLSATQHLVLHETSGGATITARLMTGTTTTQSQTMAISGITPVMTIMGTSGENIYCAWVDNSGAVDLKVKVWNATLTASVSGPTTVQSGASLADHQPTLCRRSSTSAWVAWSGLETTGHMHTLTGWTSITNAGAIGTLGLAYNCRLSSKAISLATPANGFAAWLNTANSEPATSVVGQGWDIDRGYFLAELGTSTGLVDLHATAAPMRAVAESGLAGRVAQHLCDVADTGTQKVVPLLSLQRSRLVGVSANENTGVDALFFKEAALGLRQSNRQFCAAGAALAFSGGVVSDYWGFAFPNGFPHAPVIFSAAISAGAGMSDGVYQYIAVYEVLLPNGQRVRSAPSSIARVTTGGGSNIVQLSLACSFFYIPAFTPVAISIHLYRTTANGSTFYRCTPNTGAPGSTFANFEVSHTDAVADAALHTDEILYTGGNVLANVMPPGCRFLCSGNARVFVGGGFDATVVTVSKFLVSGEPTQFTDDDSFRIYFPERITGGIAYLDGALVAFSKNAIYLVTGDGPNDQGSGTFSEPRKLPSDVGCIDYRSVVETAQGVFFQAQRGLYLLPRGFGPPVFVGADVQDTLATYPVITSAAQCVEPGDATHLSESTVRFLCSDAETPTVSRCLVFDTRTNGWSVDDLGVTLGVCGMWSDKFTFSRADMSQTSPVRQESYSAFGNLTSFVSTRLGTGDMRPFDICGWGTEHMVCVHGEYRGAASLSIDISVDGAAAVTQTFTMSGYIAGQPFFKNWTLPAPRECTSLRVDVYDADSGSGASEGLVFLGLGFEAKPEAGLTRLGTGDTA